MTARTLAIILAALFILATLATLPDLVTILRHAHVVAVIKE